MIITASAREATSIDPSVANVVKPYNALYIGVSGDISVIPVGQSVAVTFKNVPVGFFPVAVKQVNQAGTTAAQIIGVSW